MRGDRCGVTLLLLRLLGMVVLVLVQHARPAGADPDGAARQALNGVAGCWQSESVGGVLQYFPAGEGEKVYFDLGSVRGLLSRDQAERVLQKYFSEVDVKGVTFRKWTSDTSAAYDYRYSAPGGRGESRVLLIEVRLSGRRYVLNSVQVN
ncbi:MAG: hypothetical protein HYZ53_18285 [Planctomycetes bacterium]|nr:hypothetical protein [Planctomycetota bacterium]